MEAAENLLRQDEQLKKRLFSRHVTSILIFCLINFPVGLLRCFETGPRAVYTIHGLSFLIFLGILLFRKHLNPRALAVTITALLVVGVFAGVATFGMLAPAQVMAPIIVIFSSILFGRRVATWLFAVVALGLAIIAILHLSGTIPYRVDIQRHALSWVSWLLLFTVQVSATAWYLFLYQPVGEMRQKASEYLAAVFQGINDALFIHDKDTGAVLQVNQKMCAMYGWSAEEAVGLSVEDMSAGVPPYNNAEAHAWMAKAVNEGPQLFEWHAKDRQGRLFWVEVNMRLANLDGIQRVLVVVRDITERKQAEQELQMEARLNAILAEIATTYIDLPPEVIESEMGLSLGKMAEFVGADRAYIFDYDFKRDAAHITHEWCRKGIAPHFAVYQTVSLAMLPKEMVELHSRGEPHNIPDASKLPFVPLGEEAQPSDTKSRLTMPLMSSGECVGFVGFSWTQSHDAYSIRDLRLLSVFAHTLVSVRQRKQAEENLRDSARRYETLVENSPDIIARFDRDARYLFVNASVARVSPVKPVDFRGKRMHEVGFTPEQAAQREAKIRQVITTGVPAESEFVVQAGTERRVFEWRAYPERDSAGVVQSVLTLNRDVTERRRAEDESRLLQERLTQAQKIEAIGTLAGGIAHDFNNILCAVAGYTSLATMKCTNEEQLDDLKMVDQATRRATDLVRQILDFSRVSKEEAKPVMPGLIVREALKLVRASIPSTIEIRDRLTSRALVLAEPGEIHRIVVNLCTNAALAMEGAGGILEVGLDEVDLDARFTASHPGVAPGRFVRLTVKDTGCGMSDEVKARMFEPYFTTRENGQGTGMGLAVVHGVVKSRGGGVSVTSAPGQGSTFQVFLPVEYLSASVENSSEEAAHPGNERILFVDDEAMLVDVATRALAYLGYRVTPETSSLDAVERFKAAPMDFDVVVTDLTMPKLTGDKLAATIRAIRSDIPIILCSGHSERATSVNTKELGIDALIFKPISAAALSRTIRQVVQKSKH